MCKSPTRCVVSVAAAFLMMVLAGVLGRHIFGHSVAVPMPGSDIDLGAVGSWLLCLGIGDATRRGVLRLL